MKKAGSTKQGRDDLSADSLRSPGEKADQTPDPGQPRDQSASGTENSQPMLDLSDVGKSVADTPDRDEEAKKARDASYRTRQQAALDRSGAVPSAAYFGSIYIAASVIGVLPLFLTHAVWWLPWIVMAIYGIAGYPKAISTGTVFEFADSVYYLGFTLSIGALLASLEPFKPEAVPNAEKVFHLFGLGLLTTLFGVVARTAMQTFHRIPSETVEAVNERLAVEARRYIGRLTDLSDTIDRTLTEHVRVTESTLVPKLETIQTALSMSVGQFTELAERSTLLRERVGEATTALGVMTEQYQSRSADVTKSHDAIVTSANSLAGALADAATDSKLRTTIVAESVELLDRQTQRVTELLDELTTRFGSVSIDTTPLVAPISSLGMALRDAATAATVESDALKGAAAALHAELERVRSMNIALGSQPLGVALDRLREEVSALATATSEQRALTSGEVADLQNQAKAGLATARDISSALDEIATVALARLERLRPQ